MLFILKETKDYIVVCKPSGLITEQNPFEDSLEKQIYHHLSKTKNNPFLGVIHRLDKVTSGIVIFAKKKSALIYFNQLFENKTIQKTYLAIVHSPVSNKKVKLNHYLEKDNKNKRALISDSKTKLSKPCSLIYQTLKFTDKFSLLKIKPKTGRFHQIRAQLSFMGHSIVGDIKYGNNIEIKQSQSICLHAQSIEFPEFNSEENCKIEAPLPKTEYWSEFDLD